ncbi:MAG: hypothetical protein FJW30_29575 [Acidobacteria bacterium]|nr:hypothetical protein [Acidobacteriota bacterium]
MLKFGTIRFKAKCNRHPKYNPEDGEGAIRGGCPKCRQLFEIYQAYQQLTGLMKQLKREPEKPQAAKAAAAADPRQTSLF